MIKNAGTCLLAMLLLQPNTALGGVSLSFTQTSGSQGYSGNNLGLSLDSEAGFYLEGGLNRYKSDTSGGIFRTLSAGLGVSRPGGTFGLSLSRTPKVGGYRSASFGIDGSVRLTPETGGGFRAYLGGGLQRTVHQDDLQLLRESGSDGGTGLSAQDKGKDEEEEETKVRQTSISIHQNDLTAQLRLSFDATGTGVTLGVTKSLYDEELVGNFLRKSKVSKFPGILATLEGYPDRTRFVSLSQDILPWLWASASYSKVRFKLGTGSADSYNFGAGVSWNALEANVGYNKHTPSSGASKEYYSVGVGLRF